MICLFSLSRLDIKYLNKTFTQYHRHIEENNIPQKRGKLILCDKIPFLTRNGKDFFRKKGRGVVKERIHLFSNIDIT